MAAEVNFVVAECPILRSLFMGILRREAVVRDRIQAVDIYSAVLLKVGGNTHCL